MSLPGTADMVSMCGEEAPIQWADVCGEGTWEAAVEVVSEGTSKVSRWILRWLLCRSKV